MATSPADIRAQQARLLEPTTAELALVRELESAIDSKLTGLLPDLSVRLQFVFDPRPIFAAAGPGVRRIDKVATVLRDKYLATIPAWEEFRISGLDDNGVGRVIVEMKAPPVPVTRAVVSPR